MDGDYVVYSFLVRVLEPADDALLRQTSKAKEGAGVRVLTDGTKHGIEKDLDLWANCRKG
jgi:hypothetical protein